MPVPPVRPVPSRRTAATHAGLAWAVAAPALAAGVIGFAVTYPQVLSATARQAQARTAYQQLGDYQQRAARNRPKMASIAAGIQRALAARPDVSAVRVSYVDGITLPGAVTVDAILSPHAAPESFVDDAARRCWVSKLTPLESITITLLDGPELSELSRPVQQRRVFPTEHDTADMTSRYGPRP